MQNMSHTSIKHDMRVYADTQILDEEKLPCHEMIMTGNVRFDQAYHDWMIKFAVPKGVSMVQPWRRSVFHSSSPSAPFCITAGEALKKRRSCLCAQNNYVEISLFKIKPAPVLLWQTEIWFPKCSLDWATQRNQREEGVVAGEEWARRQI